MQWNESVLWFIDDDRDVTCGDGKDASDTHWRNHRPRWAWILDAGRHVRRISPKLATLLPLLRGPRRPFPALRKLGSRGLRTQLPVERLGASFAFQIAFSGRRGEDTGLLPRAGALVHEPRESSTRGYACDCICLCGNQRGGQAGTGPAERRRNSCIAAHWCPARPSNQPWEPAGHGSDDTRRHQRSCNLPVLWERQEGWELCGHAWPRKLEL